MSRFLTIFEVSQKQSFIFSSNALKTNIRNSDIIAYITDCGFISEAVGNAGLFNRNDNLVYSGGGHTILEFSSFDAAVKVTEKVTYKILSEYPAVEFFAKTIEYDESKTPGENVKALTSDLEKKKALRSASFHQGSFGVEMIDTNTKRPTDETEMIAPERNEKVPEGFCPVYAFDDLSASGGKAGFIAVVHIDGNAMGKRVEKISKSKSSAGWDAYRSSMRSFSEAVASDFTKAFEEMQAAVAESLLRGSLKNIKLKEKNGRKCFPVRRIISEGDDICFVCDGRIGIECADLFIKALVKKKNAVDNEPYAACAGVSIVHQKYPFYRAYELAEQLCSNAKKFGASLSDDNTGSTVSAIDWHIEYGELQDSLEETRKQYITEDGKLLNLRPLISDAPEDILGREPVRVYSNFKKLMTKINNGRYPTSLLKGLRGPLKRGEADTRYYLRFHKSESIARDCYQGVFTEVNLKEVKIGSQEQLERKIFIRTADESERSILFDAIEAMDVYLFVKEAE